MKNCEICGAQIPDEVEICPACGNELNDDTEVVIEDNKFFNLKKHYPLICAAVAVVLVIVLIISLISNGGYKSAINNYIGLFEGKSSKIEKIAPEEYWDYYEEQYDKSVKDIVKLYEDSWESREEELEEEYGKHIKISYDITDKEELDKNDLRDLATKLKDKWGIKKKNIKEAYELEIELKIKGSEDEDIQDLSCIAVKINGSWYLCNNNGYFLFNY